MPKRIQMSRQHPWRAENPDAVIVSRPSRWGNKFPVCEVFTAEEATRLYRDAVVDRQAWQTEHAGTIWESLNRFDDTYLARRSGRLVTITLPTVEEIRAELAGRDVACWCGLDQPCHGDVLMEIANGPPGGYQSSVSGLSEGKGDPA